MAGQSEAIDLQGSPDESRVGQTVLDRYEIVRLIAAGGMGSVYEATHRVMRRRVALKFLRPDLSDDPKTLARFQHEAMAAGALENENICSIIDVGTTRDDEPCLVMEYLEGENLARLLEQEGPLPVPRAVEIVRQVCRGLEAAHRAGVIHRDLKPKNLIVCRHNDGTDWVKIVDFGIAKRHGPDVSQGQSTTTGATLGTPHYMSPEQARGEKKLDARTDVYSVGVILYELLSGQKPHPGESYNAIIYHILSKEPVPLCEHRPEIPEGLAEIVHRAMAVDPEARTPSAHDLERALGPYAPRAHPTAASPADSTTMSRVPAPVPEESGRIRRYAASFVVGALFAGSIAWGVLRRQDTEPQAEPSRPSAAPAAPGSTLVAPSAEPSRSVAAPAPSASTEAPAATSPVKPRSTPKPPPAAAPPAVSKARGSYDFSNPYQ